MIAPELIDGLHPYLKNPGFAAMDTDFLRLDADRRHVLCAGLRFFRCAWAARQLWARISCGCKRLVYLGSSFSPGTVFLPTLPHYVEQLALRRLYTSCRRSRDFIFAAGNPGPAELHHQPWLQDE